MSIEPVDAALMSACEAEAGATLRVLPSGELFATALVRFNLARGEVVLAPLRPAHGNAQLAATAEVVVEYSLVGVPHAFTARFVRLDGDSPVVARPGAVTRIQRRRFFRVPAEEGARIRLRVGAGVRERPLLDLSAGGVAVWLEPRDRDLTAGSRLPSVEFPLGEGMAFTTPAVVRHVYTRDTLQGEERIAGLEFDALTERERDRLVSYVMQRERDLLRRRQRSRSGATQEAILVVHGPGNRARMRFMVNVSTEGASIRRMREDGDLVPGAHLPRVELRLPGEEPLATAATVRRVSTLQTTGGEDAVCTLEFDPLPEGERARLEEMLARYAP